MADYSNVRLELDALRILKKRERWQIYFLLATEVPGDAGKVAISRYPQTQPIRLTRKSDNEIEFAPEGAGADGKILLECPIPSDQTVRLGLYLMQDRRGLRNTGDAMDELGGMMNKAGAAGTIVKALGGASPWIAIGGLAVQGVAGVGKLLEKVQDRQLGYISMDESFDNDFAKTNEVSRKAQLYSGNAELSWSWIAGT